MAFYQLHREQKIPASLSEVWDFISSPKNLKDITPPHMGFTVTGMSGDGFMYPGMIITYKVSPLFGIKLNWVTEITHIREKVFFVDEQRIGPYKMWHHQHIIAPVEGGTVMTDIVTYQPPFGFLGAAANTLIIQKQLKNIFDFRVTALNDIFGTFRN